MSLFVQMNLACPNCGAVFTLDAVGSLNADRRPDLRDQVLDGSFQMVSCGECEHSFRLEPDFIYLDAGRNQWIAALPARKLRDHLELAAEKQAVFDASFGQEAPAAAQQVGQGLHQRLVFGWPALVEKLVLAEAGIDDVLMEAAKLDLLRNLPEAPMAEGIELRVTGLQEDLLQMVWVQADSEEVVQAFQVGRDLYDALAADPTPWEGVTRLLADGPFVDIQKLFMGEGKEAAA